MSLNLVLDNLRRLKEDAAFIIRFLIEHEVKEQEAPTLPGPQPSSPVGHGRIGPPHIFLEEQEALFVAQKLRNVGKMLAELENQWSGKGGYVTKDQLQYFRNSFYDPMAKVKQSFSEAYDRANLIVQRQTPIHGDLYSAMIKYQVDLLYLERRILEVEAFSLSGSTLDTSYINREIEEALSTDDHNRLRVKQTIFFRADSEANQLLRDLLTLSDDKEVDRKFGQLMNLSGFDYEIYDKIPGNLDLLLFHVGERIGILVETTKQQPSKQKVDQVAARTKEYTGYLTAVLGEKPSIYPLLVTTNEKPEINKEARFDAATNEVAIFTSTHVKELVDLLKKGKLDRKKVIDMIRKSIPT